ncbi:alpha/beta hydrolase-fold protein [Streptomyces sp. ME08-AFT2]|uniref:alpha/beta hydrolase n=1 Tax=Streptomyces sp. ME08-AFT2 TaxID=3028683 RepID=UPI0029BE8991|nr:alpha/beta hydrolase-fold protein [Streptomyces sp. ME08-AFT2]MDX3313790.1 alpha/beta hydrolase-fold protein [Streptomyces sp. ME08-AFT2]
MSLTGTPFLYTLIVVALLAVALPLLLWSRMRGPRLLRVAARMLMLLFAQGTAVALVFVLVNNANSLYDTWDDLLGTGTHVQQAADLGADGTGGITIDRLPKVRQQFEPATGPGLRASDGVRVTQLEGQVSGVNAEVYVWLPPQYDDPAYAHRSFPVVELLPGYPGSPKSWYGSLRVQERLAPLMRSGEVAPFILVAPRTTLLPGVDTGCANVPHVVNADSWLSIDVPKMVRDNFRAQPAPTGWAVAGYSAGAHCAVKLAVAHPDRFRAAVSLSGYSDPIGQRYSLAAKSPSLRRANNPYLLLRQAVVPPAVALYLSGQPHDGYEEALALRKAAKAPTTVHVVYFPKSAGGHTMALWRPQVVPAFRWLTLQMEQSPDGGGRATGRPTPAAPSSDGSRREALASGTASPEAAARKR